MRRAALALLCTLAGALGGCGSSQPKSDAGQIQQVFDYYLLATERHNADLLCTAVIARAPGQSVEDCVDQVAEQMRDSGSDLFRPDKLRMLRPPEVDGDTATVRVANDGRHFDVHLVHGPIGWRLLLGSK